MRLSNDRFFRGRAHVKFCHSTEPELITRYSYETLGSKAKLYDVDVTDTGERLYAVNMLPALRTPIHEAIEVHFDLV